MFTFPARYEDRLITLLRYTLAVIFIWFGGLKILGYNPVVDLVENSIAPFLASRAGPLRPWVFQTLL